MGKFLALLALATLLECHLIDAVPLWRKSPGILTKSVCNTTDKSGKHNTRVWHDDVLGDLVIDDNWYVENRPINDCPFSREHINTQFILHTQQDPGEVTDTFLVADKKIVDATTFDPTKPIKFIIHGFIDTGNCDWLKTLARSMLRYGDYNVIRTNWGDGSLPMYAQAAANTRVVGLEIAHLVNFFIDTYGVDPANVHLLGHSLGSHISGYAGEKIPKLGRITGMDPAGPYYTDTPTFVRLDEMDAVFVDCVHTDAQTIFMLGYGTMEPMGNLDFYPNAGFNQPGCDPVDIAIQFIINIPDGVRELAACSHQRSIELITDSFDEPCPYVGHECTDYDSFESGRCATCGVNDTMCAVMGIHAEDYKFKERINAVFYFDTDKKAPFCYYHYQVVVDTAHPKHAPDNVQGHLDVTMYGDNGLSLGKFRLTEKDEHFENGQPKYFLVKSHTDLDSVIRMEVKWDNVILLEEKEEEDTEEESSEENGSNSSEEMEGDSSEEKEVKDLLNHKLYIKTIHVSPMDHDNEKDRLAHTKNLCEFGKDYTEMDPGHTKSFAADDSCYFQG